MAWYDDVGDWFVGAGNTIVKPFKKLADGDIGGALEGFWDYTPIAQVSNLLDKTVQSHVHLANATGMGLTVIVAANDDWAIADVSTAAALAIASFGSSAPSGLQAIRNARTLGELYKATRFIRGAASLGKQLYQALSSKGTTVKNNTFQDLHQRSQSNPLEYLNPSQWAAISGGSDLTLWIMLEDGRQAKFNTNSDTSWIATPTGYCQAVHGKIWQKVDAVTAWDSA